MLISLLATIKVDEFKRTTRIEFRTFEGLNQL